MRGGRLFGMGLFILRPCCDDRHTLYYLRKGGERKEPNNPRVQVWTLKELCAFYVPPVSKHENKVLVGSTSESKSDIDGFQNLCDAGCGVRCWIVQVLTIDAFGVWHPLTNRQVLDSAKRDRPKPTYSSFWHPWDFLWSFQPSFKHSGSQKNARPRHEPTQNNCFVKNKCQLKSQAARK